MQTFVASMNLNLCFIQIRHVPASYARNRFKRIKLIQRKTENEKKISKNNRTIEIEQKYDVKTLTINTHMKENK